MIEGVRHKGSEVGGEGKRNLILCLDGTWNNKDSSTSILSLFNLIEPLDRANVPQVAYYDEGVGTGVLDGITGGGFGLGLDANVREAYNWLISEYHEGDDVYIFGFSRGAYTARSLVGFISSCGLLKRGAPMTVSQLWEGYALLGIQRENKEPGMWEKLFGRKDPPFRRISSLVEDSFERGSDKRKLEKPNNPTEKLLVECSRRIPIQFLGIFDTVGAMGWEALAIPGLQSKLSVMHNMYVTSIIRNCRHALAIDENRSSFIHTPMHQWLDRDWTSENAEKKIADWKERIDQRWFVGAHSNIGGGYPDNVLSVGVLDWMMAEARAKGLNFSSKTFPKQADVSHRRDSFAEFAAPFWTKILRAKRHWRRIDPPFDVKAETGLDENGKGNGYARKFIDEAVHPDALALALSAPDYTSPNLIEYAARESDGEDDLAKIAVRGESRVADWLDEHRPNDNRDSHLGKVFPRPARNRAFVVVWACLAAVGLMGVSGLVNGLLDHGMSSLLFASAVFFLVAVDWVESKTARSRALRPDHGFTKAFGDAVYWARAVGVVLFFIGTMLTVIYGVWTGLGLRGFDVPGVALCKVSAWWALPVGGLAAVGVVDAMDRRFRPEWLGSAALLSAVAIVAISIFLTMIGSWLYLLFPGLMETFNDWARPVVFDGSERLAGLLVLLQIALFVQWKGFSWVGEPMREKRLGRIVALQRAWTPDRITGVLRSWRDSLTVRWEGSDAEEKATQRMKCAVSEAIHRDGIGFIPLYSVVAALGYYCMSTVTADWWLSGYFLGLPLWTWLVFLTAGADFLEDALHLRFVENFGKKEPTRAAAALAGAAVVVKFVGFLAGLFIGIWMMLRIGWIVVVDLDSLDWRGGVGGTVWILTLLAAGAALLLYLPSAPKRFAKWREKRNARKVRR